MADYVEAVDIVTPLATPRVIQDDADDDHVIAAAVAAEADVIISGDGHLLALGIHQAIRVVPPADGLVIFRSH
jgi:predicted nucleic acid-binding protein